MKRIKISLFFLIAAVISSLLPQPPAAALDDPNIGADAAVIAELGTDFVFYAKNENARVYPASLTKIMTVMLAAEAIESGSVSADSIVTASDNISFDLSEDGSTLNIVPGESMSLRDLMYCALISSANEACNIIAEYISGNIYAFIERMNAKAVELGCTGTRFANTHGLPNEGHYTTAWDFYLITKEALNYPLFTEICRTQQIDIPATNLSGPRSLTNTNALLGDNSTYTGYYYEYARGVKTGWHSAAGYCLSSYAVKSTIQTVCVVMNAKETQRGDGSSDIGSFSDTITLFEWSFNNFSYQEILKSTEVIATIPIAMGSESNSVSVRPESSFSALLPNELDPLTDFEQEVLLYNERDNEELSAPITAGEVLGEISLIKDGEVFATVPLVAVASVELSKMVYIKDEINKLLNQGVVKFTIFILALLFILYLVYVTSYRVKRIRHNRTVRQARKARAMRQADEIADDYYGQWGGDAGYAERTDGFRVDNFDEDDYYENEPIGSMPQENAPSEHEQEKTERDYYEEFFK